MSINSDESKIPELRLKLALALSFTEAQAVTLAEPYLNYIENRHTGDGTLEEYLELFIKVIERFCHDFGTEKRISTTSSLSPDSNSVQAFIDTLCKSSEEPYFTHTRENGVLRKELVTDTVLYILGVWVCMLSYFVKLPGGYRQIEMAYHIKHGLQATGDFEKALREDFAGLLKGSGLLSSSSENQDTLSTIASGSQIAANVPNGNQTGSTLNGAANINAYSQFSNNFLADTFSASTSGSTPLLHTRIDSLESLSIKSSTLNAYTLSSLGGVRIHWTINLSRHLLLSRFAGRDVLEVFALPCVLRGGAQSLRSAGVPAGFIHEVQESYSILFNATGGRAVHSQLVKTTGVRWFCWCRSCSLHRLRQRELNTLQKSKSTPIRRRLHGITAKSEFDPLLEDLMRNLDPEDWSYELFPHLWERIVALEEHLGNSKPWSFWVLLRDRRDTLQFWTFFFGTVILILTVAQVALGAAQVAGSF